MASKKPKADKGAKAVAPAQWPVQLDRINPGAEFLKGKELVLAADCTGFAFAAFHDEFLKGKALAVTCPTEGADQWSVERLSAILKSARPRMITVAAMDTPCCNGLLDTASAAQKAAGTKIPMRVVRISTKGEIVSEMEA